MLKNSEMKQKESSMLTHLEQFAGTSRHNPAILDASLIGDGLGELAARGLLIVRTDTGEAWITQDGLEAMGLPATGDRETRRLERFVSRVMDGVLFDPGTMDLVRAEVSEGVARRMDERRRRRMERNRRQR